eukprot:9178883-Alexandrium_andersonii.AAC.1
MKASGGAYIPLHGSTSSTTCSASWPWYWSPPEPHTDRLPATLLGFVHVSTEGLILTGSSNYFR